MGNTWIIDMRHYLDAAGAIARMPTPARRLADHFGAIVAAVSDLPVEELVDTPVRCRRRPGRRPCTGDIQAVIDAEARIRWQCPACGDDGVISGWQGTPWDLRRVGSLH